MTTEIITSTNINLYEQDYCLWLEEIIQQLRDNADNTANGERVLPEVDLYYLIEELEGMSRREKR